MILICTEEFESVDFTDFGCIVFSVECVLCAHDSSCAVVGVVSFD